MNKIGWLRKALVLTIIALFIGAGFMPTTIGIIEKKTIFESSNSQGYIQDLIDNASSGDSIYIPSGTYYENIVINKSISLVGENKNTTIIDGGGVGNVVNIFADWVNIIGFTIQNSGGLWNAGIYINSSNNNTITYNNILNNDDGIYLEDSSSNTITGNNIESNYDHGIVLWDNACNNNLTGNNISKNSYGIYSAWENCYNTIISNTILNNRNRGILLSQSCNFNTIVGNTISNNKNGIFLGYSMKNTIIDNTITSNNEVGILFREAGANTIISNNISSNNGDGIYFHHGWSTCMNNIIRGNTISSNNGSGIFLDGSISNIISYNTISSNNGNGINLTWSNNNNIHKNNFLNNKQHASFEGYRENTWMRNYWNRLRILPKLIFGKINIDNEYYLWVNIDWRPALKPHNI